MHMCDINTSGSRWPIRNIINNNIPRVKEKAHTVINTWRNLLIGIDARIFGEN